MQKVEISIANFFTLEEFLELALVSKILRNVSKLTQTLNSSMSFLI